MKGPKEKISAFIKILRPHQWSKNLFVIAPVVFAKELFVEHTILKAVAGAILFCIASGSVYAINDVVDAPKDRTHPVKKFRPVASGTISTEIASGYSLLLACISIVASVYLSTRFAITLICYFILNLFYSFLLKNIFLVDVICVAGGFLLRVIAGSYAASVKASRWILVCTFVLSLFLALGKRKHELLVTATSDNRRPVLKYYTKAVVNKLMWITGIATAFSYSFYTFSTHTKNFFHTPLLPITIPFVIFGLWRFIKISDNPSKKQSPTDVILTDMPFVINILLWVGVTFYIIYINGQKF